MKLTGTLSLICLIMAMAATALGENSPVLDTAGQPLQRGVDYYIKPAITDNGGRFTLVDGKEWCELYAGQENDSSAEGFPVTFAPFAEEEDVVRESRDLKITFSAITICIRSTTWQLESEKDPESGRRLIGTGSSGEAGNYFRITLQSEGIYSIQWCPTEFCPICRFDCGSVGVLVKDGKRFLALDGSVLPVVFERA
ncbi:Proteinase inhibitor I3, Kunitz legume [Parasponia andersonii]|uniref:Proteinase inhibitor I3, Kunitz legume n=1 Tax=Parasponia andersonii TaxID=3476 RepID=A0A2P5D923_PARAD|nr:Proteinase inhibitor I3, Kunitz legume [Parasponia andersonii]